MAKQIIFLHIPKTGGTSIEDLLRRSSYFEFSDAKDDLSLTKVFFTEISKSFAGHFTWESLQKFEHGIFKMTFIRDPLDRLISHFNFYRSHSLHFTNSAEPNVRHKLESARSSKFRDFLQISEIQDEFDNRFLRTFLTLEERNSLTHDHRSGPALIQIASQRMLMLDFVGRFEEIEKDLRSLCAVLRIGDLNLKHLQNLNDLVSKNINFDLAPTISRGELTDEDYSIAAKKTIWDYQLLSRINFSSKIDK